MSRDVAVRCMSSTTEVRSASRLRPRSASRLVPEAQPVTRRTDPAAIEPSNPRRVARDSVDPRFGTRVLSKGILVLFRNFHA
jgi:hypothetical protein